jgi:hypothetical protein
MLNAKTAGMLAAAFVAGSFIASPELRAFAADTVLSGDIVDGEVKTVDLANNAVTATKIKDGEVKSAEIATDAVGAAELQGVTKLLFGQCAASSSEGTVNVFSGDTLTVECTITGVDSDDSAIAVKNSGNNCFDIRSARVDADTVFVDLKNACSNVAKLSSGARISIIVFDK